MLCHARVAMSPNETRDLEWRVSKIACFEWPLKTELSLGFRKFVKQTQMEAPIMLHRRIHSMTSLTILASPHSPESCMTKYAIVPMKQMARWHNPIMGINKIPSSHNSLGEHELSFFCLELREQKKRLNSFKSFFIKYLDML